MRVMREMSMCAISDGECLVRVMRETSMCAISDGESVA